MTEQTAPPTPLHFTTDGGAVCGALFAVNIGPYRASFDEDDIDINCPGCRLYLRGYRAGKAAR